MDGRFPPTKDGSHGHSKMISFLVDLHGRPLWLQPIRRDFIDTIYLRCRFSMLQDISITSLKSSVNLNHGNRVVKNTLISKPTVPKPTSLDGPIQATDGPTIEIIATI
jgi:hypothetical protein